MYSLVELFNGKLLWTKAKDNAATRKMKQQTSDKELFEGMPEGFEKIWTYINHLQFAETPKYDLIREMLTRILIENGTKFNDPFDWESLPQEVLDRECKYVKLPKGSDMKVSYTESRKTDEINEELAEKYHAQLALQVIEESNITIKDQKLFIDCILATDMSKYKEYSNILSPLQNGFDKSDISKYELVAYLLMMCGNIANTTRPFYFAQDQANKLLQEQQEMGKLEEKAGIPVQPFADKKLTDPLELVELSFIIGVSLPLMSLLETVSDDFKDFKVQVDDNREQWAKSSRKAKK